MQIFILKVVRMHKSIVKHIGRLGDSIFEPI